MHENEHHIAFSCKGRFYTHGNKEAAKVLILAFHGYGQLAEEFIDNFSFLDPDRYFIVCPEGLHRFYLKGTSGDIGASWMTREDRDTDISNYRSFVKAIVESFQLQSFHSKILLGFSQGGATASRILPDSGVKFDRFILWASVFPEDMEIELDQSLTTTKNYFVVGNKDRYISAEKAEDQNLRLNASAAFFEFIKFDGLHNIEEKTLLKVLA